MSDKATSKTSLEGLVIMYIETFSGQENKLSNWTFTGTQVSAMVTTHQASRLTLTNQLPGSKIYVLDGSLYTFICYTLEYQLLQTGSCQWASKLRCSSYT